MADRVAVALVAVVLPLAAACDGPRPTPAPLPTPVAVTPPAPAPPPAVPPDPNDRLPGTYSVTFDLGDSCRSLLGANVTRRYTANVASRGSGQYVVSLSGSRFLGGGICTSYTLGLGCEQFTASRRGDQVDFQLINNNDDAHGGHIVERTEAGTWLEIIGSASGKFDEAVIEASGSGTVWYCSQSLAYPFPCGAFSDCGAGDLKLRFVRQ